MKNFIVVGLITAMILSKIYLNYTNRQERIIHIKQITSINTNKSHKYLIFTDEGVFENTDALFIGKFNSSDLQNQILNAKVCKVETLGYRIPFLSEYPNIVKIYECKGRQ